MFIKIYYIIILIMSNLFNNKKTIDNIEVIPQPKARKAKAKSFVALIKSFNHKEKYSYSLNLDGKVASYKKEKKTLFYY